MIQINDYIINKDQVIYIEKYASFFIIVHFKNGQNLEINCHNKEYRDKLFDKLVDLEVLGEA